MTSKLEDSNLEILDVSKQYARCFIDLLCHKVDGGHTGEEKILKDKLEQIYQHLCVLARPFDSSQSGEGIHVSSQEQKEEEERIKAFLPKETSHENKDARMQRKIAHTIQQIVGGGEKVSFEIEFRQWNKKFPESLKPHYTRMFRYAMLLAAGQEKVDEIKEASEEWQIVRQAEFLKRRTRCSLSQAYEEVYRLRDGAIETFNETQEIEAISRAATEAKDVQKDALFPDPNSEGVEKVGLSHRQRKLLKKKGKRHQDSEGRTENDEIH